MTQIAVHDALNAIEPRYEPYAFAGTARDASAPAAVAAAAHDTLVQLVPQAAASVDAALSSVPDGPPVARRPGLDHPSRGRARRRGRRGPDRSHETARLRHGRRARRRIRRLSRLLPLRRQRAAVRVLVLDLRPLDGRPGRLGSIGGVVAGAIFLSAVNSYLLPDVLHSLPSRIGLDFDFSVIASGVYGAVIVLVMLLDPRD